MKDVILIFFIVLSVSFAISYVAVLYQLKNLKLSFAKVFLENITLIDNAEKLQSSRELSENDIHRENFIKFLSDSRDWAFTYIEDVQNGLTKFVEEIDPSINYFSDFSTMSEGNPLHNEMKIISNAYKDLKKFLPENVEDK
jgi:hypothetical protein